MKRNRFERITLFLIISFTVYGCFSGEQNHISSVDRLSNYEITENKISVNTDHSLVTEIDSDTLNPEFALASESFINREYIELKTPEGIIIGEISKIQIEDEYMVIMDSKISKKVYLFKENGEFVHQVGISGSGPEEYLEPRDVNLKQGQIHITDRTFTVNVYDLNNTHLKRSYLPFFGRSSFIFDDGTTAYSNNKIEESETGYHLMMIKGKTLSNRLFPGTFKGLIKYTPSVISSNPEVHGDSFLYYPSHSNEIYSVHKDSIALKYRIVSSNPIPAEILGSFDRLSNEKYNYTWIFDWPDLETQDKTQIRISRGGVVTIFLDKYNQQVKAFAGIKDDLLYGGIMDFPLYTYGNKFYTPLHVEQMYSMKMKIKHIQDKELLAELREERPEVFRLMENIDEISNPIIMKCDIN